MTIYRFLFRYIRRSSPLSHTTTTTNGIAIINTTTATTCVRSFAFSSAEEAAAERRRRKRRLRIEPPLHALRHDPTAPRPRPDPNAPRLPDSTSALVGPRLSLHNRVQSLIRSGDLDSASATARQAVFSRTRPTVFTCNAIMASMYRSGRLDDAVLLFDFFFNQSNIVPNIVSYNVLINTHCDAGRVDSALDVYRHILSHAPFSPSAVTYRHLTKGHVDSNRISEALDLLREMLNKGHGADSLVYNTLVNGFLNLHNNLNKALELFDELRERCLVYDGVVHATFMDWYFKQGMGKEAMESYRNLLDRQFKMSAITCNTLLEVLLRYGKKSEACVLFDHMLDSHTPPNFQAVNTDSYNLMVNNCFQSGKFLEAVAVFKKVGTKQGSKPYAMDVLCFNNILEKLCANGLLSEAEKLLGEMTAKSVTMDVATYKVFIDAYFGAERIDDVLQFFDKMVVEAGLKPTDMKFCNEVFSRLVEKGRNDDAAEILGKSYEIVITGLCKDGRLDCARDVLDQMVKHGIIVTPTLGSFVYEAFGKERRIDEIERLFGMKDQVVADGCR